MSLPSRNIYHASQVKPGLQWLVERPSGPGTPPAKKRKLSTSAQDGSDDYHQDMVQIGLSYLLERDGIEIDQIVLATKYRALVIDVPQRHYRGSDWEECCRLLEEVLCHRDHVIYAWRAIECATRLLWQLGMQVRVRDIATAYSVDIRYTLEQACKRYYRGDKEDLDRSFYLETPVPSIERKSVSGSISRTLIEAYRCALLVPIRINHAVIDSSLVGPCIESLWFMVHTWDARSDLAERRDFNDERDKDYAGPVANVSQQQRIEYRFITEAFLEGSGLGPQDSLPDPSGMGMFCCRLFCQRDRASLEAVIKDIDAISIFPALPAFEPEADLSPAQNQALQRMFDPRHLAVAIRGPPGSGKTTIIARFVFRWTALIKGLGDVARKASHARLALYKRSGMPLYRDGHLTYTQMDSVEASDEAGLLPFVLILTHSNDLRAIVAQSVADELAVMVLKAGRKDEVDFDGNVDQRAMAIEAFSTPQKARTALDGKSVFVATLSNFHAVARNVLPHMNVQMVIVDVASLVYVGECAALLSRFPLLPKITFIGDPKQLPPSGSPYQTATPTGLSQIIDVHNGLATGPTADRTATNRRVYQADQRAPVDTSVARLLEDRSASVLLDQSFRLPEDTIALLSHEWYDGRLYGQGPLIPRDQVDCKDEVMFCMRTGKMEGGKKKSLYNDQEATTAINLAETIGAMDLYALLHVKIICFYAAQRDRIIELLRQRAQSDTTSSIARLTEKGYARPSANEAASRARAESPLIDRMVATVDSFMDRSDDIVILCTTRSELPHMRSGFILSSHRQNVALTRFTRYMIVICHPRLLKEVGGYSLLSKFSQVSREATEEEAITTIKQVVAEKYMFNPFEPVAPHDA